ncbi:hypothetical protein [Azospirillum largimobile]
MPDPPRSAPSSERPSVPQGGASTLRPHVAPDRPRNCPSRPSLWREG